MRIHTLKIEQQYLNDLVSGDKTFEIRFNDRDYQRGDTLRFFDYSTEETFPPDRSFDVLSVFSGTPKFGLQHGWVILSLKQTK